jgi:glycosyltransferase involved in cell wall biosynthesis
MASSVGVGLMYHLTRLSIAMKKNGHDVTVLSGPREQVEGLSAELEKSGIERLTSNHIDKLGFPSIYKGKEDIRRILRTKDIDIIHANGVTHSLHAYLGTRLFCSDSKPAIVTSIHSIPSRSILQKPEWTAMVSILRKSSDMVLPVSDDTKKQLIMHGLNPQKTITVHNAIDLEIFDDASKRDYIDLEREDTEKPAIIYAANLVLVKGQEYYLMAAAKILGKHKARFYVIGDGPRREYLEKLAHSLEIEKDVIFTGRIHWPKIYYVLSNIADICVSSSISENFPFFILECMAARKPIVATNVGGVSEAVIEGVNGYLVPPRDSESLAKAIITLIENPEHAEQMGLEGRKFVEKKFSMPVLIEKLEKIYESTRFI